MSLPTRLTAGPCASPTVEPGWSTTPSAPIASPIASACTSETFDFLAISRSFEAQLIR